MAKKIPSFICEACQARHAKWMGKCDQCGQWNSIVEIAPEQPGSVKGTAVRLGDIAVEDTARIKTGIGEFDLICGGGIVPGSIILIGGEPGIGKSTIALQIASKFLSLYISGEESPAQIKARADRIGAAASNIMLSVNTSVDEIIDLMETKKPALVIIDSIQTLTSPGSAGSAGSVSQIRESAARVAEHAKKKGTAVILIGHITKEGSIAGPKVLEHLVDTVLYFEGDFSRDYRILRAFKNRYGSVNEIGIFRMTPRGLEQVEDKNRVFLSPALGSSPGHSVTPVLEGSRIILIEVQSLVTFSPFPNPRRMADGMDTNRLIIIAAVLEKHADLKLGAFDIFINIAGGLQIGETSADLAVAMAMASSLKNRSIEKKTAFIGEISLSGEVRPVSQCLRRINELSAAGFERIMLSDEDMKEAKKSSWKGELIGVKNIGQSISAVFS